MKGILKSILNELISEPAYFDPEVEKVLPEIVPDTDEANRAIDDYGDSCFKSGIRAGYKNGAIALLGGYLLCRFSDWLVYKIRQHDYKKKHQSK